LLLSIAGTRQIDRAFEVGVSTGRTPVVVVVVDASEVDGPASQVQEQGAKAVESLLELATFDEIIADEDSLREWFEIDETELAATDASLETLVCERVALLSLER
jgi:KEOPS complex subunit Cgi121